jgi:AraC-like DNA-binding protein
LENHLQLWSLRLQGSQEWANQKECLSFLLVREGRGKLVFAASGQEIGRGDILFFGSGCRGKLCAADRATLDLSGFSLSTEHLFPLFHAREFAQIRSVPRILEGTRVYPASSNLAPECHNLLSQAPAAHNLRQRGQMLLVAASILNEEFQNSQTRFDGEFQLADHELNVLERLSHEELINLPVSEIARKVGCSRWRLNRLTQHFLGLSTFGLKMEVRLLKAAFLLRAPGMKIINVAEQSGFNHLGLFNAAFRKRFGVTPSEWRKTMQNGNGHGSPPHNVDPRRPGTNADANVCRLWALSLCPRPRDGICALPAEKVPAPPPVSKTTVPDNHCKCAVETDSGMLKIRVGPSP